MGRFRSRRVGGPEHLGRGFPCRLIAIATCLAALTAAGAARAQVPARTAQNFSPISSDEAERQLRNAANRTRDRQWAEAIDLYERVIERFGDKVTKPPKGEPGTDPTGEFLLFMDTRRYCHLCIAHLPPEAREIYRSRVDGLAARWYQEGVERRDEGSLRRVVDVAFCSSWGDDALEWLGDLAFQDGRYGEAVSFYQQLVTGHGEDPLVLIHPDPSVDLPRVAAKELLCRAAMGNPPSADDLAAFAARYPGAEGKLAGRTGPLARIVAEAIAADHLESPGQPDGRWPTFAGAASRTRIVPGPIDVGQVQWKVDLEKVATTSRSGSARFQGLPSSTTQYRQEQLLAFHPIVLGDQVIVCDGSRVLAYNLSDRPAGSDSGDSRPVTPAWRHDPDDGAVPQAARPHNAIPRYTLTAAGHRIFARMGHSSSFYTQRGPGRTMSEPGTSSIVALDWNTQGKLLWEKKPSELEFPDRPGASTRTFNFEGTPVADARNVYVAMTDRGQQTMMYVACFDAETGEKKWIRLLGAANPEIDHLLGGGQFAVPMNVTPPPGDYRHRLLTLDGSTIYYQTNLGALVALDAETGAARWVATYPRQDPNRLNPASERDLNPAVVDDGRVLVAPSDADSIFAFDASSGRLLWKTDPIADEVKLAHVLGVAKGRLVVTGDRVLLLDVRTGKVVGAWPDAANKSHEGYGRGLLAGDLIYWPTRSEIEVLSQRTGLRAEPPIKLQDTYGTTGGNLAAGDGYLIVAKADGLVVFCQNSRLIERYRQEIVREPNRASNYYRLARAAEAIGREETALESYREALDRARPDESIDGLSLATAARDRIFRMLLRRAAQERGAGHWDVAARHLGEAAPYAGADAERLEVRLVTADIQLDAGHPGAAVEALEQVLLDSKLRPLPVAADEGRRTIRADLLVADRIDAIVRKHGRDCYEPFDRRALALLDRGRRERDPHPLAEVGRDYPAARVVPESWKELGAIYESRGRFAEAAHAYKRLLAVATDDALRAQALWSMARVYDARKLYIAARDAYVELQSRYPRSRPDPRDTASIASDLVARRLAREPYVRLVADRAQAAVLPPLGRRWHWTVPDGRSVRALSTLGVAPSLDASRIVLGSRDAVKLLDASDGTARWSAELGSPALWAGYLEDKLIAAGPRQVVALDLATGSMLWRYRSAGAADDSDRPDPFTGGDGPAGRPRNGHHELHGFRLVKGRVFCLRGPGELIALDGDSGSVDWSLAPTSGQVNPNVWIGPDRIVLEIDRPNHLLVLRTDDGQPVARTALSDKDELDHPPVPLDDDSALVVLDPRTVKKLDLNTGQFAWEYRESEEMPVDGPPRLIGEGEMVLVLHEGRTLIRLDPATGSKRWSCPLGYEDLSGRSGAIAFDDRRFYCISRFSSTVTLRAISLADGTSSWTSEWIGAEDSSWAIALGSLHVFAYPIRIVQGEGIELESIPIVIRRRDTGLLVERMLFPIGGEQGASTRSTAGGSRGPAAGAVTFSLDHLGAVVATPRGVWGLGPRESLGQSSHGLGGRQ